MTVARDGDEVRIGEWNLTDAIVCVVYRASTPGADVTFWEGPVIIDVGWTILRTSVLFPVYFVGEPAVPPEPAASPPTAPLPRGSEGLAASPRCPRSGAPGTGGCAPGEPPGKDALAHHVSGREGGRDKGEKEFHNFHPQELR